MTQTSEIFLVGYSDETYEPATGELTREGQHKADNIRQFFLELADVQLVDPIVLYTPEPAGEMLARTVAEALPDDLKTSLIPSPYILEGGEHPSGVQRVDYWLGPNPKRTVSKDWESSTIITITHEPLVRHLNGEVYDWLFADSATLDDVVRYEPVHPGSVAELPDVGVAMSGEHLLNLAPDVPMRARQRDYHPEAAGILLFSSSANS